MFLKTCFFRIWTSTALIEAIYIQFIAYLLICSKSSNNEHSLNEQFILGNTDSATHLVHYLKTYYCTCTMYNACIFIFTISRCYWHTGCSKSDATLQQNSQLERTASLFRLKVTSFFNNLYDDNFDKWYYYLIINIWYWMLFGNCFAAWLACLQHLPIWKASTYIWKLPLNMTNGIQSSHTTVSMNVNFLSLSHVHVYTLLLYRGL